MKRAAIVICCCLLVTACQRWGPDRDTWDGGISDADGFPGEQITFAPPPDVPADITLEYRIAHGDILVIDDSEHPDARREDVLVDNDGTISFLMLDGIPAAGLTFAELSAGITQRLSTFHRNPIVDVSLANNGSRGHRLYVFGQVVHPGELPYDRPMRILDALAAVGGFELEVRDSRTVQSVDLAHSTLQRRGETIPIDFVALVEHGDLRYNIQLHPGDLLNINSLLDEEIYVLGAVTRPGAQHYLANLTVVGALSRAGGVEERARRNQVAVVRGNLGRPIVHLVDMNAILAGKTRDMLLHPGDVVYVADRPTQYARELAVAAIRTFSSVLGARFGVDAFPGNSSP